jgi:acetylornithine/succinyldiaminopimelate/putrescine aminotransferase
MSENQTVSLKLVVSQGAGNIVSDMDGEKVMLSIKNGKYYNLGELGGEVWELMKDPISVQELVTTLHSLYDVDRSKCEEQVTEFLNQLMQEDLIQIKDNNN